MGVGSGRPHKGLRLTRLKRAAEDRKLKSNFSGWYFWGFEFRLLVCSWELVFLLSRVSKPNSDRAGAVVRLTGRGDCG